MKYDYLIVGAGFAGSVCAEQLASGGNRVLLIDKRPHIGGNAYDCFDEQGVLIHPYGPHIFHTNSKRIFEYLSQFTNWRFYEHRVLAMLEKQLYPIPINRTTINKLYGLDLNEDEVKTYLESVRVNIETPRTSEEVVLSSVGRDLCDKFFRGYTRKQWGLDLAQLSSSVASRIPTRFNDDDRYFTDTFQFMPANGYTKMFERMLSNDKITIELGVDFNAIDNTIQRKHTIYTGAIDAYYKHIHGVLPYRSLRFEHEHMPTIAKTQKCGTINYPNENDFTRITEFKHLTGQSHLGTSIVREYPTSVGDPYYPIPRPENESIYKQYQAMANVESEVSFVGRLAQYRYYNMDQVVGSSLALSSKLLGRA